MLKSSRAESNVQWGLTALIYITDPKSNLKVLLISTPITFTYPHSYHIPWTSVPRTAPFWKLYIPKYSLLYLPAIPGLQPHRDSSVLQPPTAFNSLSVSQPYPLPNQSIPHNTAPQQFCPPWVHHSSCNLKSIQLAFATPKLVPLQNLSL